MSKKPKQEVWRFDRFGALRMVKSGCSWPVAHAGAGAVYGAPPIGGVLLSGRFVRFRTKLAVANEIKRQLAEHWVDVEIRKVSK